jgi:hypothetical protein
MKATSFVCFVFATCLLGAAGCKKAPPPQAPGTIQQSGVTLELPKLDTEFKNASPDVQAAVDRVKAAYSRGQLSQMMAELNALNANPSLTEPQKQLIGNLINEMKQVMNQQPGAQ